MKRTIFKFISVANQYLFFFGFTFFVAFIGYQLFKDLTRDRSRSPDYNSIQIVGSKDESDTPIEYRKSFIEKLEDVFIFRVRSNRLEKSELERSSIVKDINYFSGSSDNNFETVNFMFVKENEAPVNLLESPALITNYDLVNKTVRDEVFNKGFVTSKHLFTIILEDTNNDSVLNSSDVKRLMSSHLDGSNLVTIAENLIEYEIIDNDLLLITTRVNGEKVFTQYDLSNGNGILLNTEIPRN